MDIKQQLAEVFRSATAGPFLFLGSGFSRRYLGLEDWKGLLSRFCVSDIPFEYYLSRANGSYPAAAALIAQDFNDYWWTASEYKSSVARYKSKVFDATSALRIEISAYLNTLDQTKAKNSEYAREVELLSGLNVDGVITTNWDLFIEQIFPDYKPYIGQKELLFSNPQQIGEIYKIHGCSSAPSSLVLTNDDYREFNERNAYLAAKLITIFVEHPIVFIGYRIADPNVSSLLHSIASCIGSEHVEQLRQNLIFVQRLDSNEKEGISNTYLTIDGVQIPLVLVKTNDFVPIYEAIDSTKRKIPARVLRYCKEELYELVKSSEPEKKICVIDIDEIDKKEDVEFLVGVGVASGLQENVAEIGYAAIEALDLLADLLHEDRKYDASQIVENVVKSAGRNTRNIPVYKYLVSIGIDTEEKYQASGYRLDKWVKRELKDFRLKSYAAPFFRTYRHQSMKDIIEACTPENAAAYIPYLAKEKIDVDLLRDFLIENQHKMDYTVSGYASSYRKLAALYDKIRWGW
ncbi:hypothetical protein UZ73_00150 [Alcaligenes faecalis]|uniref:SIR2 family protein n=1 Tax=Alcaligenes faecalis TaxID=511 RepID=UPI0005F8DA51|nr:SIR2 family protein [Alcaligenes faecalis]ALO36800.1 hypothetical protein UZ73_00150 [Alcaligenes faecalis]